MKINLDDLRAMAISKPTKRKKNVVPSVDWFQSKSSEGRTAIEESRSSVIETFEPKVDVEKRSCVGWGP